MIVFDLQFDLYFDLHLSLFKVLFFSSDIILFTFFLLFLTTNENKINNSYNPTMIQNIKPPVNQEIKQDINQNINQIANQRQSYNSNPNDDILEDPGNEQGGVKMTSSINNSNSREMSPHSSIIKKGATPNPETPGFIPNFSLKSSFKGHNKIIVSMIELENKKIATGSYDYSIKIWDLSTQNCELVINEEGRVFSLLEFEF